MNFLDELTKLLTKHEGNKKFPYQDTNGYWTIGIGHNLSELGLSESVRRQVFLEDIGRVFQELSDNFKWVYTLDDVRLLAVCDMLHNLGLTRFKRFVKFLAALEKRDYITASVEMLDSKWAEQVGDRAIELAYMVRNGVMRDGK